ncbi:hypothetical protein HK105_204766 [Polyrhizophydium stewartii]|uniref:Peptidase S59 domain-containing protein n=1 Tax=Polyrhizophydium stewartii TaxID=2732419 RepID=A0ABR4N7T0_9FUNG
MPTNAQSNQGTGNPAFQETIDRDGNTTTAVTKFQSITAMPAYQNWSFEELRLQDYVMNKRFGNAGAAGQAGGAFGMGAGAAPAFGAAAPAGGLFGARTTAPAFGATPAPAFGAAAPAGGLFGNPATTAAPGAFGAPATTQPGFGFGANPAAAAPKPAFGFGAAAPAGGGLFGNPATTQPAGGAFGAAAGAGGGLFGARPAAAGGGLFGNPATTQPAGGGLFGAAATTQPPTGAFGAAAPGAAGGLFGAAGAGAGAAARPAFGAFGATTQPGAPAAGGGLFGAAAPAGGGLFGNPATTAAGGAFGAPATTQAGFGAPAAGGGLFGAAPGAAAGGLGAFGAAGAKPAGGLFGGGVVTTQAPGLGFGMQQPAGAAGGGLFGLGAGAGAGQGAGGGLFGAAGGLGTGFGASGAGGLGGGQIGLGGFAQPAPALNPAQPVLQAKIDQNPYGFNPLLQPSASQAPSSQAPALVATPAEKKKPAVASSLKVTPRSAAKIKLRGLGPNLQPGPAISDAPRGITTPAKPGIKSLQLTESSPRDPASLGLDPRFTPRRNVKRLVIDDASEILAGGLSASASAAGSVSGDASYISRTPFKSPGHDARRTSANFDPSLEEAAEASLSYSAAQLDDSQLISGSVTGNSILRGLSPAANKGKSPLNQQQQQQQHQTTTPPAPSAGAASPQAKPSDYIITPTLRQLLLMSDDDLRKVENFTVSLPTVGSVRFDVPVDLLDASPTKTRAGIEQIPGTIVILQNKLCIVYPDEEDKPPVGHGLNVPATIELFRCWPIDKVTRKPIMEEGDPRHDRHMKKLMEMPDTEFRGFHNSTGCWRFSVEHFSKYGLEDDDDDDEPPQPAPDRAVPSAVRRAAQASPSALRRSTPASPRSALHVRIVEPHEQEQADEDDQDNSGDMSLINDSFVHTRGRAPPSKLRSLIAQGESSDEGEHLEEHDDGRKDSMVAFEDEDDASPALLGELDDAEVAEDDHGEYGHYDDDQDDESDSQYEDIDSNEDEDATDDEQGEHAKEEQPALLDHSLDDGASDQNSDAADIDFSYASHRTGPISGAGKTSAIGKQVDITLSEIKRMGLSRNVQAMKGSLFRSSPAPKSAPLGTPRPAGPVSFQMRSAAVASSADKRQRSADDGSLAVQSVTFARGDFDLAPQTRGHAAADASVPSATPHKSAVDAISPQKYQRVQSPGDAAQLPKAYLHELPTLKDSIASGRERDLVDAGLFMGRSFRVGWGPSGSFVVTGRATRLGTFSSVAVRKIEFFGRNPAEQVPKHVALLETALSQSVVHQTYVTETGDEEELLDPHQLDGGDHAGSADDVPSHRLYPALSGPPEGSFRVPRVRLLPSFTFSIVEQAIADLVERDPATSLTREQTLWRLASALWDPMQLEDVVSKQLITQAQKAAVLVALRREALSAWLAATIKREAEDEAAHSETSWERILALLTGRLVASAVGEAVKSRNLRLATMLAQVNGPGSRVTLISASGGQTMHSAHGTPGRGGMDPVARASLATQLRVWQATAAASTDGADSLGPAPGMSAATHIPPEYMDVLRLIAGDMNLWDDRIFTQGMSWMRAFGVFFWYGRGGDLSFPAALEMFETAFVGAGGAGCVPVPRPPHRGALASTEPAAASGGGVAGGSIRGPLDVCFHLLKIAADPAHPLEAALDPLASTPQLLDYRVSWLLAHLLSDVKGVRRFRDMQAETAAPLMAGGAGMMSMVMGPAAAAADAMGSDAMERVMRTSAVTLGQSTTADRIALGLVAQLEALGMWRWAVFVALSLGTCQGREACVRALLAQWYPLGDASGSWMQVPATRSISDAVFGSGVFIGGGGRVGSVRGVDVGGVLVDGEDVDVGMGRAAVPASALGTPRQPSANYLFLTERLLVPAEWIHEARALQARYLGNTMQELVSLIDAKKYGSAQRILIAKVAPERIINGSFKLLKRILAQISEDAVENWSVGAGLFWQYIDAMETVPLQIQQAQEPATVSLDASPSDLAIAQEVRSVRRRHLVTDAAGKLQRMLSVLGGGCLDKMRALAAGSEVVMTARQERLLTVAVAEMAARVRGLLAEISMLKGGAEDGVGSVVGSGAGVEMRAGLDIGPAEMARLPLVPDQRLDGIRTLASDWLRVALA